MNRSFINPTIGPWSTSREVTRVLSPWASKSKLCTPVTRHNLEDVPNIARLAEEYAETTRARVFYNIFQTFRRSMDPPDWESLLVTDEEFAALSSGWLPAPGSG